MANDSPQVGLSAQEWVEFWDSDFAGDPAAGTDHEPAEDCGSPNILNKYLSKLTRDKAAISVLVSLCGDSADVVQLANKGHNVTGIEISEKAVKCIFEDPKNPIPYSVTNQNLFKLYSATNDKKISIYVGNFFDTLPCNVGPFDAIWDDHGIVSMPERDMQPYADKLKQMMKPDGVILFSSVWYDIRELTKGPAPVPMSTAQLVNFFGPGYTVELLEDEAYSTVGFEGVSKLTKPVNLVTKS